MNATEIVDQPVSIHTTAVPTVSRWDTDDAGTVYLLEFEDAGASARLSEEQARGLGARILSSTMTSDDDLGQQADDQA